MKWLEKSKKEKLIMEQNNNFIMDNQEDIDSIYKIYKIRNNLMNYIPMEELIEKARTIIDECEDFSFRSSNARKFISPDRPEFIIKLDNEDKVYQVKDNSERELDKYSDSVGKLASDQILTKIGQEMRKYLNEDKEFQELLEEHDEEITNLMLSNIYIIKAADPKSNNISLRLFV